MSEIHPQQKTSDALMHMLDSRKEQRLGVEADLWLAGGWNPFMPQKNSENTRPAIELMLHSGRWNWNKWIQKHSTRLSELASETFMDFSNESSNATAAHILARCARRHEGKERSPLIACLDDWKIPPDLVVPIVPKFPGGSDSSAPALFDASPWGAKQLLSRGAHPSLRSSEGCTLWEYWARRHMRGVLTLSELDEIEKVDSPERLAEPGLKNEMGYDAIYARSSGVALRLAQAGCPPSVFGVNRQRPLSVLLCMAVQWGDTPQLIQALGIACGWPEVSEALWEKITPRLNAEFSPYDSGSGTKQCAARRLLARGAVATLSLLERAGALDLRKAEAEMLPVWNEQSVGHSCRGIETSGRGLLDSAAWLYARLPADAKSKSRALEIWQAAAGESGAGARACALKMSALGWIPGKGPGSLRQVFEDGARWDGNEAFEAFEVLCEKRALSFTVIPKKSKKKVRAPRL